MKELITYDPKGSGENYGIQYHGEDLIKFLKAIHYLICEKKMPLPLSSHHGLDFYLKSFGYEITLLTTKWTHSNKGNGELELRIILRDHNWKTTIDENGNSFNAQGLLINERVYQGFLNALERSGWEIEDGLLSGKSIYADVTYKPIFVATILPPQEESKTYKPDKKNPEYQKVEDDFIHELKKIFDYYQVLN